MSLTVVTYNVYNNASTFAHRLPVIIAALKELAADVVALQEVPQDGEAAHAIARALGDFCVASTVFTRPDDGWSEALAVLSRFPVSGQEDVELRPGVPNCFRVQIATPEGGFDLHNAHLHPRDADLRIREATVILERISGTPRAPAILCGDFNALPDGDVMALLLSKMRSTFETRHGRHPETTFPTPLRPELLTPAADPAAPGQAVGAQTAASAGRVLDYILVRPEDFVVEEARLVCDQPSQAGLWPSDHYGVLARLARRRPSWQRRELSRRP
jgi:endonuclease/exonuclease/phosphatase family metal-dependent hydrolase